MKIASSKRTNVILVPLDPILSPVITHSLQLRMKQLEFLDVIRVEVHDQIQGRTNDLHILVEDGSNLPPMAHQAELVIDQVGSTRKMMGFACHAGRPALLVSGQLQSIVRHVQMQ